MTDKAHGSTTNSLPLPAVAGGGRLVADRLGIPILGAESGDWKTPCSYCGSSDAGRLHQDTGFYHCYSCGKNLSNWDHFKVRYGHDEARRIMVELGFFAEDWGRNSNGHSSFPAVNGNGKAATAPAPALTDEQAFLEVCRLKNMPPDAVRKYGGVPCRGGVKFPMFGPEVGPNGLEQCSTFVITLENDKGRNEKGKPSGLFLPGEFPDAGQSCIVVEGPKDAAAVHSATGQLVIGLPGNRLYPKFVPLFKGVHVTILADGGKAGKEGAAVTFNLLKPVAASVKIAYCPDNQDDPREVIKAGGAEAIRQLLSQAADEPAQGDGGFDLGLITATELLRKDCKVEFLIPKVLAKGQHAIGPGGPLKCCKTLIATDMAVSLATGGKFLDHFPVTRPVRTILLCGESGWPVFQENIRRISEARCVSHSAMLDNLFVGVKLPKFGNPLHQETLIREIERTEAEAIFFDCAYRCISGESVSNQFAMGEVLDAIGTAVEAAGATLILLCHTPKHVMPGEPLELDNVAFAGFSEFAAQWLILNRQRKYESGSGHHDLWAVVGGRAGHSGLYGIGIDEGEFQEGQDREWRVSVQHGDEVRQGRKDGREKEREAKQQEKLETNRKRIAYVAAKFPQGESKTVIRDRTGLRPETFNPAWASLLDDGTIVDVEITKPNRKKPYPGFRLRDSESPC